MLEPWAHCAMASIETAILHGVAYRYRKKPKEFESWLEDFGEAFADIAHGLATRNSIDDALYHRKKIMTFLLVTLFDSDALVKAFDSKWRDIREFCDTCVPFTGISYHDFFEISSFLGLGRELTSVIEVIDVDIQDIVGQHLCDWVKSKTAVSEDIARNIDVTVTLFMASLVIPVALKATALNDSLIVSTIKKCHELLFLATHRDDAKNPCITMSATYAKCMQLLFKVLEHDKSSRTSNVDNTATPDVLYLNKLKDALGCSLSKYSLHQAIADLISMNKSQKTEDTNIISQVESSFLPYVVKSLHRLKATSGNVIIVETCDCLEKMLDLDAGQNEWKKDLLIETPKWKNDIIVVANCLDGYKESAVKLLASLVNNPTANWREITVCFQSSPQCLAVKSNLIIIMDIISQCTRVADSEKRVTELSKIVSEFQELFWKGFILLTVRSKYDLAKEIIFSRKDYNLLSSYMIKTSECGATLTECNAAHHKAKKAIRNFFEKIINEDVMNDSIQAEFSHICLLSPSLCLTSLVENAFRNRIDVIASLLLKWDYLLQFPYNDKQSKSQDQQKQGCLFWSTFFECLKYHFMNEDGKSVDNGMALIASLFKKSACQSSSFRSLIREGFSMFGKNFLEFSQTDPATMKLHLQVVLAFCKSESFKSIMSPQELLSACVTLCSRIDIAMSSWLTDPLYNQQDDLLDDVFEALFTIATEQVIHFKDRNDNDFLLITEWLCHIVKGFTWLTQLRFLPLLQQVDSFSLSVPACLADVCKVPPVFRPDTELCYGQGNGLLAWCQCFVTNSNICPINGLAIELLEAHEIKMFTNAWIITLAQILPFCKNSQWLKLIETTKLLLSDCKLYCPYQYTQLAWIPNIHIPEAYTLLGVVQVIKGVFDALCNKQLIEWCSNLNFVSLSKQFSEVCNWLVSVSPDFVKASLLSRAFILSQIFCSSCYVARLIQSVGDNQVHACLETIFILCLELLGTFEKIIPKLCEVREYSEENEASDDGSVSSSSYRSSDNSDLFCTKYHILELSSRIEEMIQSCSIMYKRQRDILIRKLRMLNKGMDEMLSHGQKDCQLDDTT